MGQSPLRSSGARRRSGPRGRRRQGHCPRRRGPGARRGRLFLPRGRRNQRRGHRGLPHRGAERIGGPADDAATRLPALDGLLEVHGMGRRPGLPRAPRGEGGPGGEGGRRPLPPHGSVPRPLSPGVPPAQARRARGHDVRRAPTHVGGRPRSEHQRGPQLPPCRARFRHHPGPAGPPAVGLPGLRLRRSRRPERGERGAGVDVHPPLLRARHVHGASGGGRPCPPREAGTSAPVPGRDGHVG